MRHQLEPDPLYQPRVDSKEHVLRECANIPDSFRVDYISVRDRPPIPTAMAWAYKRESLRQLSEDFPKFHKSDLTLLLELNGGFYAPTFSKCYDCAARSAPVPLLRGRFVRVNITTRPPPKNSGKRPIICPEFEEEQLWIQNWKAKYDKKRTKKLERSSDVHTRQAMRQEFMLEWAEGHLAVQAEEHPRAFLNTVIVASRQPEISLLSDALEDLGIDNGVPDASIRIECGCCCDDSTSFIDMMQCPDGHLFCKDCVRMQAETVIGNRGTEILCMDQSNCGLPFTRKVLFECLDERTLLLWESIKQTNDIREANVEGLENCPFCDYAVVNPFTIQQVPLFHCQKCREISCRRCQRKDHSGHPCHDQIEDAKLKAEHDVEEAMTNALLRKCPKCKAPFIKEHGCNKIVCHSCHAICCYVCRQQILHPRSYDHFVGQGQVDPRKCPLWDGDGSGDPAMRHAAEVAAAERKARQIFQAREPLRA